MDPRPLLPFVFLLRSPAYMFLLFSQQLWSWEGDEEVDLLWIGFDSGFFSVCRDESNCKANPPLCVAPLLFLLFSAFFFLCYPLVFGFFCLGLASVPPCFLLWFLAPWFVAFSLVFGPPVFFVSIFGFFLFPPSLWPSLAYKAREWPFFTRSCLTIVRHGRLCFFEMKQGQNICSLLYSFPQVLFLSFLFVPPPFFLSPSGFLFLCVCWETDEDDDIWSSCSAFPCFLGFFSGFCSSSSCSRFFSPPGFALFCLWFSGPIPPSFPQFFPPVIPHLLWLYSQRMPSIWNGFHPLLQQRLLRRKTKKAINKF